MPEPHLSLAILLCSRMKASRKGNFDLAGSEEVAMRVRIGRTSSFGKAVCYDGEFYF